MNFPEIVSEVVGHYGDLGSGYNRSSWAVFSDDFKISKLHGAEVCHAGMGNDPSGCDQIVTNYKVINEDLDLRFFDFMRFELYAPYKSHFNLGKQDGKYYIHITGLDKLPANVVYNFCITSRIILEFRSLLKVWEQLCTKGVNPKLAFVLMATNAGSCLDKKVTSMFSACTDTNHWPIDHAMDLDRLLHGKFVDRSLNFKEWPRGCTPCNVIWGSAKSLQKLDGLTIREFCSQWKKDHPDHEDLLLAS